ncbi:MAG: ferritin [Spirochaetaceae bacterium]|nr:ferritin [Spirochaetaceae bacterium]MBQ3024473.1 ferritin [Spirochaetaceae bacterium]
MLHEKIASLMNTQINKEMFSAYLYLDFANFFESKGLSGFASWYKIQAKEEMDHAMLFYQYLQNNNAKVKLEAIGAPDIKLVEFMDPLEEGLRHEEYVTSLINKIYSVAMEYKDYKSMDFLNWFIKEQGEEELNAYTLIDRMELFGSNNTGLYILNNELANRKYSPPDYDFD